MKYLQCGKDVKIINFNIIFSILYKTSNAKKVVSICYNKPYRFLRRAVVAIQ